MKMDMVETAAVARTDLELLIAPEWCTVKSIMEADTEDYTANLLWQPCCHWLLKDQSIIQKRVEGTLLL